ncbi:MAG: hypothetical protein PHR37_02235 [Eubacteriales bacterium]|nr:hypothetical protein [Eubacteriales bacterium]
MRANCQPIPDDAPVITAILGLALEDRFDIMIHLFTLRRQLDRYIAL